MFVHASMFVQTIEKTIAYNEIWLFDVNYESEMFYSRGPGRHFYKTFLEQFYSLFL
jgi:hypothetical protein